MFLRRTKRASGRPTYRLGILHVGAAARTDETLQAAIGCADLIASPLPRLHALRPLILDDVDRGADRPRRHPIRIE